MAETMVSLFRAQVRRLEDRVAWRVLTAGGAAAEATLTWGEWDSASLRVAHALVAAGHRPGEAVAVLAGSRPVWPIADLGIQMAGGVSVGIYPTSAPDQVAQLLSDAGAVAVVVDAREQRDKLREIRDRVPALRTIVCLEGAEGDEVAWDAFLESGARAFARDPEVAREVEWRGRMLAPEDTALLIYTSGSTGEPKGARISHRYLIASAHCIRQVLDLSGDDCALSFLPFCHAAERVFGLYTRILCGMEAALVEDHARVWEAARAYGPTVFGGLPRFFEKAYEALLAEQERATGEERMRWDRTVELGRERSRLRRDGRIVPPGLQDEWREVGAPLFERVRALFGGRVRMATSGGAPLPQEVVEYLDALGLTVLGAYGLTEHLCVAFNRPDGYCFDAAGPPMPGTELRIAGDGEILVRRGALTFGGYHGKDEETRESFTSDGEWLLTGDLGELDARGFLRVTGRKKELIALSTGKKIAPTPIEMRLMDDPWVAQAMLYGEGRKFVSALLVPRREMVESWARERGFAMEYRELLEHPEVRARLEAVVDRVNAGFSRTEQVRRIALLDRELLAETGELTPTLKIRRPIVAERFRHLFDPLYA